MSELVTCHACNHYLTPTHKGWICTNRVCSEEYGLSIEIMPGFEGVPEAILKSKGYPLYDFHSAMMRYKNENAELILKICDLETELARKVRTIDELKLALEQKKTFFERVFGK